MNVISNFKFKILNSYRGFTLIEALVALAILGVIGFILADILSRGFRSTNKTQILGTIKQNGQSALNILDQTIRSSESVLCASSSVSPFPSRIVVVKRPKYIRYTFVPQNNDANGYITQETIAIPVPPPDAAGAVQYCTSAIPNQSDLTVLTDQNPVTGVSLKTGAFKQISNSTAKDSVEMEFVLGPGTKAGPAYFETANSITFKTTVQLR